jgi:hypothetical protein
MLYRSSRARRVDTDDGVNMAAKGFDDGVKNDQSVTHTHCRHIVSMIVQWKATLRRCAYYR